MKQFFKRYFFILDNETKRQLPFLVGIFLFSSFLDVVGIGLVSAFLALVLQFSFIVQKLPIGFQHIIGHYQEKEVITFVGIFLISAFILKGFFSIYTQKKIILTSANFVMRCKIRLLRNYQQADYAFHLKKNSAYLLNSISLVDFFASNVFSPLLNVTASLTVVCSIIGCIMFMHPIVTLFLAGMMSTIFFLYEFFVKNSVVKMGKILSTIGGDASKALLQAIGGLKEIRVLGKENFFLNKLSVNALVCAKAQASYYSLQLIPRYVIESAASIFLVVLILGAIVAGHKPADMIPTLGVFAAACIRLLPVVSQIISQFSQLRSGSHGTDLLFNEMQSLEIKQKDNLIASEILLSFSQFSLSNIYFRYEGAKQNAINNLNMTFYRGKSIGLMGASGAGKSTLVSIILGLLTPDSGKLLVDHQPILNLRSWLNNFAYIPQSIFLLDDTLKRNIAMGTEDSEIDETRLANAIQMAQLTSVVNELPEGVDTIIGENGVRLSGGQRQRVALARAFYYEREIIVMDEATSALDNETEHEVIQSIKCLHGVKTLIVIAHRLTTLQYCDVVYQFEKGQIIAQGSFDEVIRSKDIVHVN